MGRLPEIHFSGSLLIRQGVGWVDKPNIPNFMCWVTPAANPTYSLKFIFQVAFFGRRNGLCQFWLPLLIKAKPAARIVSLGSDD